MLALIIGLLILPACAWAVFPGTNGLIVYDAPGSNGQVGIWTANPDGSNAQEVMSEPNANEAEPAASPDGRRIAFVNGSGHIAVMDVNGQNLVDLTPNDPPGGVVDASPTWSPDGTKIAFTRVDYNSASPETDVWVMSSDGSGPTNLTPGTGVNSTQPAWSPAGTKIAFVQGNPQAIWTMDSNGANPTEISNVPFDATDPSWSPDGSRLVFSHMEADLWLVDSDGSHQTQLTNNPDLLFKASSFSPDGTEIVSRGQDPNTGANNLYLVDPTTGDATEIPHTTGGDEPDWQVAAGPAVSTGIATAISTSAATLTGSVNPNGQSTSAHFEWGTSSGYGHTTAAQAVGSDSSSHAVQAAIGSLTPGTIYHYRLVAGNAQGTNSGADRIFQTRQQRFTVRAQALPAQDGTLMGVVTRSAGVCSGGATASVTCTVIRGQQLALHAAPKSGFVFTHWSGLCAGTNATCTIRHVVSSGKALAGFEPKPLPILSVLHQLTSVSGNDLARGCSANNSCAVLAGLAVGSCQSALGGNPDVALLATDDCFKYIGSVTDKNGNRIFQFTTTKSISADGVTVTPAGGPLSVSMYSDANQEQHFSIGGSPEVGFEGMDLGKVAVWNIDPVHPSSAIHYYASSWENGGATQQGNLPIPSGQAFSVFKLVSVTPPTFSGGIADAEIVVKAPSALGGATSPPTDITTGTLSKVSSQTVPTYDDGGSASQADNSCAANLAAPLPTQAIDVFHFPSLSLAGFKFEGHFVIGENPDVGLFEGSMSAPSYMEGGSALKGIYEMGYPNNNLGSPPIPIFACARLEGQSVPIPVIDGSIREMHLGIVTYPGLKIAGGGEMVIGQPLPFGSQPYPIDATGNWSLQLPNWGSSGPWTLHDDNQINFLGTASATGSLDFSSVGYVSAAVDWSGFDFPWPLSGLNVGAGHFRGAFDEGNWQLEGTTSISYSGIDLASADVIVSSLGVGGCGTVLGDDMSLSVTWSGAFDYDINDCSGDTQVQAPVRPTCQSLRDTANDSNAWPPERALAQQLLAAHDCVETGSARDRAGADRHVAVRASKQPSGYGTQIKGSPPTAAFVLRGKSGPPVATVYGPNHYRCLGTSSTGITNEPGCVVVRDVAHHLTKITVTRPAAGTWLVDPDKGSPTVASFRMQFGLTPPHVKAKVVRGSKGRMVLRYSGAPTDGRKVVFVEQGARSGEQIGIAHGARGTIIFTPSPGPAGIREIVAMISVQGVVHSHEVVATYHASAPTLSAPRLRVRIHGRRAKVTIVRVPGAVAYLVSERGTDKRQLVERLKSASFKVLASAPGTTRVTLTVAAIDANGFVGRRTRAQVKLRVNPPKLIPPAFHKRHRRR